MVKKFDHVALAVRSSGETLAVLSRLFGFETVEIRSDPEAGFRSTLISKGDVRLELLEPDGVQGMVQRFLEKRGEGMHHISLQVTDLDEEMARLKAMGVQFLSEAPAIIDGAKVIFIHPRSAGGLLFELVQRR